MTDDTETERLPLAKTARKSFTAAELEELRDLYWDLPSATEAAAELLGNAGPAPNGMRLERFMELNERVVSLIVEIDTILSR
jgi:hypothetical protein